MLSVFLCLFTSEVYDISGLSRRSPNIFVEGRGKRGNRRERQEKGRERGKEGEEEEEEQGRTRM